VTGVLRSMTGYGAAGTEDERMKASVTVRSLNHRYLDLSVHLSRRLFALEADVRRVVQGRLQRGRVEVSVQASFRDQEGEAVVPNRPLIAGLVRALRDVQSDHALPGEIHVTDVMRFPGAFEPQDAGAGLQDGDRELLLALVGQAVDGLEQMRVAEGARLGDTLVRAVQAVEDAVQRIESLLEQERGPRVQALQTRARALLQELGLEEQRLYQELVRLVDRGDVAEELQRLRSHAGQARAIVEKAGPCGKRLDFLAQEMGREANTIGSKSDSAALAQEVVGLKGEIERFREQVQNVE
jgi:uncharacterized protein (TIGR00255 family)